MSEITIKSELKHKASANGYHQVMIRITQNKRHIRKVVKEVLVRKNDYNGIFGEWISKKNPNYKSFNSKIELEIAKYKKEYNRLKEENVTTSKADVFGAVNKVVLKQDFIKFLDSTIDDMENYNNEKGYTTTKNKILEFTDNKPFDFTDINKGWLQRFDKYMKDDGLNVTTRHIHLKKIRRAWNIAVADKVVSKEYYPFGQANAGGFKMPSVKNVDKELERLTIEEIESIFQCQYHNPDVYEDGVTLKFYAQKAFLLAFLCAGIRVEDLLTLKWNNEKNGYLSYKMKKGVAEGKLKKFKIEQQLRDILDSIKKFAPDAKPTDYIFPFMPNGTVENTGKEYKMLISTKTALYNKNLKLIAIDIGCSKNITSHVARHSWAAITYETTFDLKFIQENLDHEDIATTIKYIGKLTTLQNDQKMQNVYAKIFAKDTKTPL